MWIKLCSVIIFEPEKRRISAYAASRPQWMWNKSSKQVGDMLRLTHVNLVLQTLIVQNLANFQIPFFNAFKHTTSPTRQKIDHFHSLNLLHCFLTPKRYHIGVFQNKKQIYRYLWLRWNIDMSARDWSCLVIVLFCWQATFRSCDSRRHRPPQLAGIWLNWF